MPRAGMLRLLLAALLISMLALAPAAAREEIRSFAAAIAVNVDSSVDVTETIEVNAEGSAIRRGIFRDIFTTLVNPDGSRLRSSLSVVSVLHNGDPATYRVETLDNGNIARIRIGDADILLPGGVHRYQIRYTMTRMARQFESYDELYWNVTGNFWDFPILEAVASVTLPDGAEISNLVAYTGPIGSTAEDATVTRTSDTTAIFRANNALDPGEGMTVAVAFARGVLVEPDSYQRAIYWLSDRRDLVLPLIAVFIVLLYYWFAWDAVGRDPRKSVIIPLFHAPRGISPALVHYIWKMGWEKGGWTAFTAAIFNLGVKGLVVIDQVGKELSVKATGEKAPQGRDRLGHGEQVLFDYITSTGTLTVDKTSGARINTKRGEMLRAIESENREVWFRNNTGYTFAGLGLSLVMMFALVLFGVLDVVFLIVAGFLGVVVALGASAFNRLWQGGLFTRFFLVVWGAIFFGNIFGGVVNWFDLLSFSTPALAAFSIVAANVVFAILLRAPTVQGRKVMDQIEGFRMYLETAEKERLNLVGEPQMTVPRFEAILPYAIALGVEKPWSEHFEGELARNAVPDASSTYAPRWYSGRSFSSSGGGFSNSVAAATAGMSAAMLSAQPSSSSSSGFSGGGSSGGGGGGGGGGGW